MKATPKNKVKAPRLLAVVQPRALHNERIGQGLGLGGADGADERGGEVLRGEGDEAEGGASAPTRVAATRSTPLTLHWPLEPLSASTSHLGTV